VTTYSSATVAGETSTGEWRPPKDPDTPGGLGVAEGEVGSGTSEMGDGSGWLQRWRNGLYEERQRIKRAMVMVVMVE
jgi:hypothetical protein